MAYDYETLGIEYDKGVLTATINNPPVNVMTQPLYLDLVGFTSEVEKDESVKVVVFQSADPDFFIAHFDVEAILEFAIDTPAEKSMEFSDFHLMCERVRTMPKATIVKMAGRAGGGGNEFASSCTKIPLDLNRLKFSFPFWYTSSQYGSVSDGKSISGLTT